MKKCAALFLTVILIFALGTLTFAQEYDNGIIDLGTEDLGNGFTCHTVLILDKQAMRASSASGTIGKNYYYGSSWVGYVSLYATFSYNGSSATALSASAAHSVAAGWRYGTQSVWRSGPSAYCTASFSGSGGTVPVSLALTCSPSGSLS